MAFLLITFVLIQVVCPMLFVNDIKWWVSGGVVARLRICSVFAAPAANLRPQIVLVFGGRS